MARGFLSGIVWGGVLGLGVTGVASVLAPLPMPPEVTDAAPGAAQAPERIALAGSGETASASDPALSTGQAAPQAPAPNPDDTTALGSDTQTSADQPQTGQAAGLEAPAVGADGVNVAVDSDDPVLPNPQALAPMAPQPADDLSISTEPAQPPAPEADVVLGAFDDPTQPSAQALEEDAAALETEAQEPATQEATVEAQPAPEETTATAVAPLIEDEEIAALTEELQVKPLDPPITVVTQGDGNADLAEGQSDAGSEQTTAAVETVATEETAVAGDAPATQQAAQTEEVAVAEDVSETDEIPVAEEAAAAENAAEGTPTTEETAEAPPEPENTEGVNEQDSSDAVVRRVIGTPSITLTDRNTGVTVNRPGNAQEQTEAAVTLVDEVPAGSDLPPVKRFAQAVDLPADKPMMGIVLIDDGTSPVAGAAGIAALRNFPYPLSFAVDTSLKDAADRMATYRGAGFEVLAMIDLPEGAVPTDAETTLGAILPVMSQVVGVLEGTRGGLQGTRDVSDQVTAILAQTGHGLLTQDKGLNTMPKLARKEGVPASPVFRDFDSKGQTAQVIRRFLDQAAFKAGQEGAVVMLGRLRPDTVSALLLWGLQDRASSVALAPISAVLLRDQ